MRRARARQPLRAPGHPPGQLVHCYGPGPSEKSLRAELMREEDAQPVSGCLRVAAGAVLLPTSTGLPDHAPLGHRSECIGVC